MERENLKKLLAGLGVATLIAGAGLSGAGNAWAAWSGSKPSAGGTQKEQMDQEKSKDQDKDKQAADDAAKAAAEKEKDKKPSHGSWSGSMK